MGVDEIWKCIEGEHVSEISTSFDMMMNLTNAGVNEHGDTLMHHAVRHGAVDSVQFLLSNGCGYQVVATNRAGQTPFHLAAERGRADIATKMLRHGCAVELQVLDHQGRSALWEACANGHADLVPHLARPSTLIEVADAHGLTPLHISVRRHHGSVVEALCKEHVHADQRDPEGRTALYVSSWNGDLDIVRQLVQYGASISALSPSHSTLSQWTPLHAASQKGWEEVVHELLHVGASVRASDSSGLQPLHLAAHHGHVRIVRMLVAHGADRNAQSGARKTTALWEACAEGHWEVVRELLQPNTELDLAGIGHQTALQVACARGHAAVVALLLPHESSRHDTLRLAVFGGHAPVVQLLMEHGPPTVEERAQAVRDACLRGDRAVLDELMARGADVLQGPWTLQLPSAAHAAAWSNHAELLQLLSERARPLLYQFDALGRSPLIYAASNGATAAFAYLIGSRTEWPAWELTWALMYACRGGHLAIVDAVLNHAPTQQSSTHHWAPLIRLSSSHMCQPDGTRTTSTTLRNSSASSDTASLCGSSMAQNCGVFELSSSGESTSTTISTTTVSTTPHTIQNHRNSSPLSTHSLRGRGGGRKGIGNSLDEDKEELPNREHFSLDRIRWNDENVKGLDPADRALSLTNAFPSPRNESETEEEHEEEPPSLEGEYSAVQVAAYYGKFAVVFQLKGRGHRVEASALHLAARGGKAETVRGLVERGLVEVHSTWNDQTALQSACEANQPASVRTLIELGADVHQPSADGRPLLDVAIALGHTAVAQLLLDHGAVVATASLRTACVQNDVATTAQLLTQLPQPSGHGVQEDRSHLLGELLADACACGHEGMVRLLLDQGAPLLHVARPALTAALAHGHERIATLLLVVVQQQSKNAPPPPQGSFEDGDMARFANLGSPPPLHWAVRHNLLSLAELLLASGAQATYCYAGESRWAMGTALHVACRHGHVHMAEWLMQRLDCAADPAALLEAVAAGHAELVHRLLPRASSPPSPELLWTAASSGHERMFGDLLLGRFGGDWSSAALKGALWRAAAVGNVSMAQHLLQANPQLAALEPNALVLACERQHKAMAEVLLAHGADVFAAESHGEGRTPLLAACSAGFRPLVELLLDHGADVRASSVHGLRPLTAAAQGGHLSVVRLLLERNTPPDAPALLRACERKMPRLVQALLEAGACPTTPSSSSSSSSALKNSLQQEEDPVKKNHRIGNESCGGEEDQHSHEIIERPPKEESADWTPLHASAALGDRESVDLLLKHGALALAHPSSAAESALLPEDIARRAGHTELAAHLHQARLARLAECEGKGLVSAVTALRDEWRTLEHAYASLLRCEGLPDPPQWQEPLLDELRSLQAQLVDAESAAAVLRRKEVWQLLNASAERFLTSASPILAEMDRLDHAADVLERALRKRRGSGGHGSGTAMLRAWPADDLLALAKLAQERSDAAPHNVAVWAKERDLLLGQLSVEAAEEWRDALRGRRPPDAPQDLCLAHRPWMLVVGLLQAWHDPLETMLERVAASKEERYYAAEDVARARDVRSLVERALAMENDAQWVVEVIDEYERTELALKHLPRYNYSRMTNSSSSNINSSSPSSSSSSSTIHSSSLLSSSSGSLTNNLEISSTPTLSSSIHSSPSPIKIHVDKQRDREVLLAEREKARKALRKMLPKLFRLGVREMYPEIRHRLKSRPNWRLQMDSPLMVPDGSMKQYASVVLLEEPESLRPPYVRLYVAERIRSAAPSHHSSRADSSSISEWDSDPSIQPDSTSSTHSSPSLQQPSTEKRVLLKQYDLREERGLEAFSRELSALGRLRGVEGIVRARGAFLSEEDNACSLGVLEMPWFELGPLAAQSRPPASEMRRVVYRLLAALEQVHRHQLVHASIHPNNILLDARWNIALAGFEASCDLYGGGRGGGGMLVGSSSHDHRSLSQTTRCYDAPERMHCAPATPSSDVYSLGLVILEMLCGQQVPSTSSPTSSSVPDWCARMLIGVDDPLRSLLQRMLHEEPYARPSAYDLTRDAAFASVRKSVLTGSDLPEYWTQASPKCVTFERVPLHCADDPELWDILTRMLNRRTAGRLPYANLRLEITAVERVENPRRWRAYAGERAGFLELPESERVEPLCRSALDARLGVHAQVNELLLFHGTSGPVVDTLCRQGNEPLAANPDGKYGRGSYFGEDALKCDKYCSVPAVGFPDEYCMFVSRVLVGRPYHTAVHLKNLPRPPCVQLCKVSEDPLLFAARCDADHDRFDSIVACVKEDAFREFVVYHHNRVHHELLIRYRRCPI